MAAYKFTFIGTGNMGAALARAAAKSLPGEEILLSNRTPAKAEALARELGCAAGSAEEAAREGRYIVLGVKPQMMAALLEDLTPVLAARRDRFVLVTMAAGLTIARIQALVTSTKRLFRAFKSGPISASRASIIWGLTPRRI